MIGKEGFLPSKSHEKLMQGLYVWNITSRDFHLFLHKKMKYFDTDNDMRGDWITKNERGKSLTVGMCPLAASQIWL